ncbi:ribonuclease H [Trifolium pratense]|uniref:Ribonuclease H n=1 Tax=Trifolium pratense TaxID=57577 RepID=A0A2K3LCK0_TRIPR|nr:ribonuclease H [Trifolium pratense]
MACTFLNCKQGSVPFKYLGLSVGASPRRASTWQPMVDSLKKKLNSWSHKHISFGGRLVLINSVLNSIPIFSMSFMKMPAKMVKKVTRIQREFLWGGVNGGKRLSWIKWSVMCNEKKNGGLGVRDIKAANLSLLLKWRWRLLQSEDKGPWKEVLVAKYGGQILQNVVWSNFTPPYFASLWWKDICGLEDCVESKNWWVEAVSRHLGNGVNTRFWRDSEVVLVDGERQSWNLLWRRRLFQWEESVTALVALLDNVRLSLEEDTWRWSLDPESCFTVKSAFESLVKELVEGPTLSSFKSKVFKNIWGSPAQTKVIVFSRKLLHNRVPTKYNLLLRGILNNDSEGCCVWCGNRETANHLFLHCPTMFVVWYEIFKWLGVVVVVMPPNLFFLFDCFMVLAKTKKERKGLLLVWHSVIWSIWRARNNHIFKNKVVEPREIVDEVKVLSWKWTADRSKISPCLFYEWSWDAGSCFNR